MTRRFAAAVRTIATRLVMLCCIGPLAASASSGCVWTSSSRMVTERIAVETTPPGAWVWRKDQQGRRSLGRAPQRVARQYKVTTARFNRWAAWLGLLGSGGATAGSFYGYAAMDRSESGGRVMLMTAGILAGIVALGYVGAVIQGEVQPVREQVERDPLKIGASLPGHLDAWSEVKTPHGKEPLKLALSPGGSVVAGPGVPGALRGFSIGPVARRRKPTDAAPGGTVVAVFDIQDAAGRLQPSVLDQLTEYLAAQLAAQASYQVVPRPQLRARLAEQKRAGYKACFDAACQIELGRAVAAQQSLATRLLRVGGRCAFTSVLYDLKRETSIQAASVDTACSLEALMDGVRQVAEKLVRP